MNRLFSVITLCTIQGSGRIVGNICDSRRPDVCVWPFWLSHNHFEVRSGKTPGPFRSAGSCKTSGSHRSVDGTIGVMAIRCLGMNRKTTDFFNWRKAARRANLDRILLAVRTL